MTYLFIINLAIANANDNGLVKFHTNFMIHLLYCSWNHASLFVIISQSKHRESFSRPSLPVTHNCSIVTRNNIGYDLSRSQVIDIILSGVEHNVVEFEFPIVELVIDGPFIFLVHVNIEFLQIKTTLTNLISLPHFNSKVIHLLLYSNLFSNSPMRNCQLVGFECTPTPLVLNFKTFISETVI